MISVEGLTKRYRNILALDNQKNINSLIVRNKPKN